MGAMRSHANDIGFLNTLPRKEIFMDVQYRIGEFSNLSGVSTKTLRFYDQIGLLRPASVDARTGYRNYRPQQLEELAAILALKSLGVSLADARDLIHKVGSSEHRRDVLTKLKRTIQRSIQTATQSLKCIDAALEETDDSKHPIAVVVKRRPAILSRPFARKCGAMRTFCSSSRSCWLPSRPNPSAAPGAFSGIVARTRRSLERRALCGAEAPATVRSFYDRSSFPRPPSLCLLQVG